MKRILLLLSAITFCFEIYAQLTANAGNDQTFCGNSAVIGGSPTASGGTPPYTYAWSPFNAEISDTTAANPLVGAFGEYSLTYTLIVTDSLGAQSFDTVTLNFLQVPQVSIAPPAQLTCTITSVVLTASSITTGATFSWSGGGTTSTRTVSAPGTYSVTVTDPSNGCTASASVTVTSTGQPPNASISPPFNPVICNGSGVTLTASGGTIYSWSNGATTSSISVFPTAHTTYTVTVTNASGCTATANIVVTVQSCGQFQVSIINPLCFGLCNGSATVNPTGNYNYLWNNAATTQTVSNLCAGTYTVTVMDSVLNPLDTLTVNIIQPTQIIANVNSINVSCFGSNNGAIVLSVTGGVAPYSYQWSNGSTGPVLQNIPAGTYSVTVVDANGCTVTASATVNQPAQFNVSVSTANASGCGVCDGSATMTVNGGVPPFSYLWSNLVTTQNVTGLCPGVYVATITDSNGCTDTAVAVIQATGSALNVTTSVSGHVTCTNTNGSVTASVIGGVPPYTYSWNNGATTPTITNLTAGLYWVTVSDSSGCQGFAIDTVFDQQSYSFYVYVTGALPNCSNNGSATAHTNGGVAPFSYLWSNSDSVQTITGLGSGVYMVTVTDSSGCQRSGAVTLNANCMNVITGRIIRDLNNNCAPDSNEVPMPTLTVRAVSSGTTRYGTSDAYGYFTIYVPAGTFHISVYTAGYCMSYCEGIDSSYTHTFLAGGDTLPNLNFYLATSTSNLFTTVSPGNFRPGFNTTAYVYYGNYGTDTVAGTLTLTYDADITFVSASPGGVHNATNRTVTWTLATIIPGSYYYTNPYKWVTFLTPVGTPVGTAITSTSQITGTVADCNESNNTFTLTRNVTNSQDPNDKQVSPPGDIYDAQDSILIYTIRFQNTGNDTAWFIVLKDTLSSYLEPASVQNLSSSHPITEFSVSGTGILTWVFNPIYLVDSFTNEEASHGYVMFSVKKKPGLVIGTEIKNTASIYFDYNDAVVTNTVTSTIANPNYIFGISDEGVSVVAFPNPFSHSTNIIVEGVKEKFDFSLFDAAGRLLKVIPSITSNRFEFRREEFSAGVYFYKILAGGQQVANGKLIIH